MTDRAVIHAEFEEAKPVKTRKCLQIICEVPMERADEALEALGGFPIPGQSRPVAIALLKPGTQSQATEIADDETPKPERPKGGPICKRAVLLCKRPGFQNWIAHHAAWGGWIDTEMGLSIPVTEDGAKLYIYRACAIQSRAELDHNTEAAERFGLIERDYTAAQQGRTDEDLSVQRNAGP